MAVTYAFTQLQDIFISLTSILRNVSADTGLIRLAYQRNSAPFQDIEDGVCYVWINYADNETNKQINEEYIETTNNESLIIRRSQLRQLEVHWSFYGNEDVQDIAYEFRNRLFSYQAKHFLDNYDIKLILDVPEAVLLYEEINNQWWARVELIVNYYIETSLDEEIPTYNALNVHLRAEKETLNRRVK